MIDPKRRRRILTLALPIIGGMVSQNVLNLVDTAMVGSLGEVALAAVGLGSFANFMVSAFLTAGLSAGVQAIAARRHGAGDRSSTAVPLNGGLLLAVGIGIPGVVVFVLSAPTLFPLVAEDPQVAAVGMPYFQWRLVGLVGMGINFSFRGYWNATDRTRLYLGTLLLMHASNIALNYVLIFGKLGLPAFGAAGAGMGSMIATYIGSFAYVVLALRHSRKEGFLRGLPDLRSMVSMLRLFGPAGLQHFLFAAGITTLFWIIGRVGTIELAAATVLINVLLVALLPGIGFGLAAGALAGQALGRGDAEDATRWGREVLRIAVVSVGLLALPAAFVPDLVLGGFIHSPGTLDVARLPLQLMAIGMPVETLGVVLQSALLGAGDTRRVLYVSAGMQWLVFLPAAYLVGPYLGFGLLGIWIAQLVYRGIQAGIYSWSWRASRLTRIRV